MSAADRNRATATRHPKAVETSYKVAASTTIYKGTLVALSAGYLVPAADTAGLKVVGVALEKVDNSSGSAGALSCLVASGCAFLFAGSSIVQADVGKAAYVTDDQTVQDAANTNGIVAGIIEEVDSTDKIWVYIPPANGTAGGTLRVWSSAEITGSGSEQTNAHTLGVTPTNVIITVTEVPDAAAETGFDVAYGTHTSAAVLCTVTSTVKYRITAFAVG